MSDDMDFQCLDNCGECCQPIMMTRECWDAVRQWTVGSYIEDVYVYEGNEFVVPHRIDDSGKCVFLDEWKKCAIYDMRPNVCKDYGVVTKCPYVDEAGNPRSAEETQYIGAGICMHYALAAAMLPESEDELIARLLTLDSLAYYKATFTHGVRVNECIQDAPEGTHIEVPEHLYPRLRKYLTQMGVNLPDVRVPTQE